MYGLNNEKIESWNGLFKTDAEAGNGRQELKIDAGGWQ